MKRTCLLILSTIIIINSFSQNVGIGTATPAASAALDINSTSKGVLVPRMSSAQRNAILSPAKGLMVFDNTFNAYWYYTGTGWKQLGGNSFSSDSSLVVGQQTGTVNSYNLTTNLSRSDSSGYLYDSGGPAGNYGNNENFTASLTSSANQVALDLQVISNSLESPYDSLVISDDYNNKYILLGNAIGTYRLFGQVTIKFKTNYTNFLAGFAIHWNKLFLAVNDTYDSTQLTGWYFNPEKLYMRGGINTSNQWSPDSSGLLSFSYGDNAQAKGSTSFAAGFRAKATGENSSVSIGWQTIATGPYGSVAIGDQAKATGASGATAMGSHTLASGLASTAMGGYSVASGSNSTALGTNTTASGYSSTALGTNTTAGGDYSTALGYFTTADGDYSMALGTNTTAGGDYSTALGYGTTASGDYSTALGYYTTAGGYISTTLGYGTIAGGNYSTALGYSTTASGDYSTALGYRTTAGGNISTALGFFTKSKSLAGFVAGAFNDSTNAASAFSFNPLNRIFQIGNGTADNARSNAMTVLQNGNVGIGILTPNQRLEVAGNITVQNGKGLIRSNDGTQQKKVTKDVLINVTLAAGASTSINFSFPETFSAAPDVYVGNVISGAGGWAEVILSISNVTTTGGSLYISNPRSTSWSPNYTIRIIAIGPQ